jgi:rhamnosyltransferase
MVQKIAHSSKHAIYSKTARDASGSLAVLTPRRSHGEGTALASPIANSAPIPNVVRPKVLVLLAAFNGSRWIAEQIQSILDQADVDISLVISDDVSTDSTRIELRAFARDRRVRITSPDAPTGSAAQNFLQLIRRTPSDGYDFVALADQDDVWDRLKVGRGCSTLTEQRGAGYSCPVTAFWDDGKESLLRQNRTQTRSDFLFEGAGQGATFVLTSEFYRRVRTFLSQQNVRTDNVHFHDWLIYALSRSWNLAWCFDRDPMMRYRQHTHNDTGARTDIAGIVKRMRLIKSGWYAKQLLTLAEICVAAAPSNRIIEEWRGLLTRSSGFSRRLQIARFCFVGGRRRYLDNAILVLAGILGWV